MKWNEKIDTLLKSEPAKEMLENNQFYKEAKQKFYFYKVTGTASGFETALYDLMARADNENLEKISMSFPFETLVFKNWVKSEGTRAFFSCETRPSFFEK